MEDQKKEVNLLDFVIVFVKWKHLIISVTIISMIIGYLGIYFLIDEQYESSAMILPSEESSFSGMSGFMKNIKNFPIDIGGNITSDETSTFNTIINSRTVLEDVIEKFNLAEVFEIDKSRKEWKEILVKSLRESIEAEENDDMAYEIKVTSKTPELAADINNYLIELLNRRMIELRNKKSKENRIFLEKRLFEVKENLKISEDSLRKYQERSGIFDAEEQVKGMLGAYSTLETELITKQIEASILEKILDYDSPQLTNARIQVEEYQAKLNNLRSKGESDGLLQPLSTLPRKAMGFLRHYREVEINSAILEFVVPLYEQSKFEEQKDLPVLQVVDYAIPPVKKSYPPRTIMTLIIGFGIFLLTLFYVMVKENQSFSNSEKVLFIKRNLFRLKISN